MRFTIVTVCFNSERTIVDTLRSVATQRFGDYEHLIIDGASADTTMDIVHRFDNPRLTSVSEPDGGLYHAMNKGLRLARGEYVLFLNSDDVLCREDALSLVSEKIDETGADCIFADTEFVTHDGLTSANRIYSAKGFRRWWLKVGVMPPHPSAFIRRETMLAAGGFDTKFSIAADFDLIARIILRQAASWASLATVITRFRVGGLSTSGLATKLRLGRELSQSLLKLGQPLPTIAVQLRFPLKLAQLRLARSLEAASPKEQRH